MSNEMTEAMKRILADLKARQQAEEHMVCPRCGEDTMNASVFTNALSRQTDIMICPSCGLDEAMRAYINEPMPLELWACFQPRRPKGDFKDVPGEEAWKEIEETQLSFLCDLYDRWMNTPMGGSFWDYRREALEYCKGLTDIWERPFCAIYNVKDGQLKVMFRRWAGTTEVAYNVILE